MNLTDEVIRNTISIFSFYYSELEKQCLPQTDPQNELLMRYIDDFLLITRDPHTAAEFLSTMTRGRVVQV